MEKKCLTNVVCFKQHSLQNRVPWGETKKMILDEKLGTKD